MSNTTTTNPSVRPLHPLEEIITPSVIKGYQESYLTKETKGFMYYGNLFLKEILQNKDVLHKVITETIECNVPHEEKVEYLMNIVFPYQGVGNQYHPLFREFFNFISSFNLTDRTEPFSVYRVMTEREMLSMLEEGLIQSPSWTMNREKCNLFGSNLFRTDKELKRIYIVEMSVRPTFVFLETKTTFSNENEVLLRNNTPFYFKPSSVTYVSRDQYLSNLDVGGIITHDYFCKNPHLISNGFGELKTGSVRDKFLIDTYGTYCPSKIEEMGSVEG